MAKQQKHILIVEDDESMARAYSAMLNGSNYSVATANSAGVAMILIEQDKPDILLLDLNLPDMYGFELLDQLADHRCGMEVIIITGQGSMKTAIEAMKAGARDFLVKPFSKDRLLTTLKNVSESQELREIVKVYRKEIDRHNYCGFIGSSLAMQGVYRIIDSAAQSKATVFITGESGTGKEVCAEAIHHKSERGNKSFITINCGAIPKDLMESEIFGHVKGAFTGAIKDRDGAALQANGGTLFLDEICEMELALQPKLLRFLQTGTFSPVGSDKVIKVDCRIVCATNRNPLVEVQEGRFREDLYYRLHVLPIPLPALQQRGSDILEIAGYFLSQYSNEEGKAFKGFAPEVENILSSYNWPGNVRQLQNVIRNIVVLHEGNQVTLEMLPPPLNQTQEYIPFVHHHQTLSQPLAPGPISSTHDVPHVSPFRPNMDTIEDIRPMVEIEREIIEQAIELCGGNVPTASHHLGVSAATIYRKKAAWKKEAAPS